MSAVGGLITACGTDEPPLAPGSATASISAPPSATIAAATPSASVATARSKSPELTPFIQWVGEHRAKPESATLQPECTGTQCRGLCAGIHVDPKLACLVEYDKEDSDNLRFSMEVAGHVDCGVVGDPVDRAERGFRDMNCQPTFKSLAGMSVRLFHEEASTKLGKPAHTKIMIFGPSYKRR